MRVICLKPEEIKSSKTGAEYRKVSYISEQGKSGEVFLSKEEFDALNFPVGKCLVLDDVKELFEKFQAVDVEFNERGRCVGVK